MNNSLLTLTFLIPVIGLYSGLSLAITTPIFAALCLWQTRKLLEFNVKNHKLEFILVFWVFASCVWSLNPLNSLISAIKSSTEFLFGLLLVHNIAKIKIKTLKIEKILLASLVTCFILFGFEYLSEGKVSLLFRELFQKKESNVFYLHNLDRGIALLTLVGWLIIGFLLKKNNNILAILTYAVLLVVLIFSDNLAAMVGHVIAAFVFLLTRFTIFRNPKILCLLLAIGAIFMFTLAFKIDPHKVSQENELLPLSAKHRLFIWNYVAENSKSRTILGIGFNSTRIFPVDDSQIIDFRGAKLHPLPVHPHNNIMQVYFELGIIGLILYLALACKYLLIIGKNYRTDNYLEKNWIAAKYACFSAYFTIAMISYNLWQSWWMAAAIWVCGLFVLFSRKERSL